jgi:hypothetical protein
MSPLDGTTTTDCTASEPTSPPVIVQKFAGVTEREGVAKRQLNATMVAPRRVAELVILGPLPKLVWVDYTATVPEVGARHNGGNIRHTLYFPHGVAIL